MGAPALHQMLGKGYLILQTLGASTNKYYLVNLFHFPSQGDWEEWDSLCPLYSFIFILHYIAHYILPLYLYISLYYISILSAIRVFPRTATANSASSVCTGWGGFAHSSLCTVPRQGRPLSPFPDPGGGNHQAGCSQQSLKSCWLTAFRGYPTLQQHHSVFTASRWLHSLTSILTNLLSSCYGDLISPRCRSYHNKTCLQSKPPSPTFALGPGTLETNVV